MLSYIPSILENLKIGGSRELFLLENDFKFCYTVSFPKNIEILQAWKPTKDNTKFSLELFLHACFLHINSVWYYNFLGHVIRTSSKCHKFQRQNFKKISQKFWAFWALYPISWSAEFYCDGCTGQRGKHQILGDSHV